MANGNPDSKPPNELPPDSESVWKPSGRKFGAGLTPESRKMCHDALRKVYAECDQLLRLANGDSEG